MSGIGIHENLSAHPFLATLESPRFRINFSKAAGLLTANLRREPARRLRAHVGRGGR
jgi:hypothetical protein